MSVDEPRSDVVEPGKDVETNGSEALRPIHELEDDSASTVVDWVISDQDGDTPRPSIDDVIETVAAAPVALAFKSEQGFGYVTKPDGVGSGWLHYRQITDQEKIASVASVENRSKSDVRVTKKIVDEPTVRDWVHLAIDTAGLELVSTAEIDVFDEPAEFSRGSGE